MKILMVASADRKVTLTSRFIGYEGEKNVDTLKLYLSGINLDVNWYLVFDKKMIPFKDDVLMIDENITKKAGVYSCKLIGSDAEVGKPISTGEYVFISDEFEMEVR